MKRQGRQCNLCAEILYISVFLFSLQILIMFWPIYYCKTLLASQSWQQLGHLKGGELSSFIYWLVSKLARKT